MYSVIFGKDNEYLARISEYSVELFEKGSREMLDKFTTPFKASEIDEIKLTCYNGSLVMAHVNHLPQSLIPDSSTKKFTLFEPDFQTQQGG